MKDTISFHINAKIKSWPPSGLIVNSIAISNKSTVFNLLAQLLEQDFIASEPHFLIVQQKKIKFPIIVPTSCVISITNTSSNLTKHFWSSMGSFTFGGSCQKYSHYETITLWGVDYFIHT